jgi:hypothetical protein
MVLLRCVNALLLFMLLLPSAFVRAAPKSDFSEKAFVAVEKVMLLTEPTQFGESIAELKGGLELKVLQYNSTNTWVLVKTPSGREGWIRLRETSLGGRREKPLFSKKSSSRNPASLGGVEVESGAEGGGAAFHGSEYLHLLKMQLAYQNQLSRSQSSGIGFSLGYEVVLSTRFSLGPAFSFQYFGENAVSAATGLDVNRKTYKMQPNLAFTLRPLGFESPFVFASHLGLDIDRTTIKTRDLITRELIEEIDGLAVSGSGTNFSLITTLAPGMSFKIESNIRFEVFLLYSLLVDFLSKEEQDFLDESQSRFSHTLGLGLSYVQLF